MFNGSVWALQLARLCDVSMALAANTGHCCVESVCMAMFAAFHVHFSQDARLAQ
jgi:hypothetical protein